MLVVQYSNVFFDKIRKLLVIKIIKIKSIVKWLKKVWNLVTSINILFKCKLFIPKFVGFVNKWT